MDLQNILHRISHLRWAFLLAATILIFYSFIVLPDNLISVIGIIIYLMGIQLGLESLGDAEMMSEKEKIFHSNAKYIKRQTIIILSSISVLVLISLLFMALKFIFSSGGRNELFNDFFELGLDCWALILGLLCMLKSILDKHKISKQV